MKKNFSILTAFKFGFLTVIENFAFYMTLMCIYFFVIVAPLAIGLLIVCLPFVKEIKSILHGLDFSSLYVHDAFKEGIEKGSFLFALQLFLVFLIFYLSYRLVSLGLVRISLDYYDRNESSLGIIVSCWRLLFRDFIASILYWLCCGIGMLLFIIPGIYFAITYGFYHYAIIDSNAGIFESFSISQKITKGSKVELLALSFLILIIRWIALTLFGLTLFIIIPAITLIYAYVYRQLLYNKSRIT